MDYMPLPRTRLWKGKADFFRPFRNAAAAEAGENIALLYDPAVHRQIEEEPTLRRLNAALASLADVFPDVEPEVLREMLLKISEESRIEIVTEQLLKRGGESSVRGRVRLHRKHDVPQSKSSRRDQSGIRPEEMFRHDDYKTAVKQVLYQEFRNLSHSSIKAVMAEQNHSYTLSRPILQQLTTRTWRFSLVTKIWSSNTTATSPVEQHPYIVTAPDQDPAVKRTGNAQLDQELHELFVEPEIRKRRQEQQVADYAYATELNEAEAEKAEALFDCECCFGSVAFKQLAVCNDGCHQLCYDCIQRSTNEAVYGQNWTRTVHVGKGTIRCFASADQDCQGTLSVGAVQRALYDPSQDGDTWQKLQDRIAAEALLASRLPIQRCPFCEYAEVDDVPSLRVRHVKDIWQHIATRSSALTQIMLLLLIATMLLFTVPLLLAASFLWAATMLIPSFGALIDASWARIYKQRRGLKFRCQNAICKKISCMRCSARWRDPHICFEDEKISLRTAIESSATAAVKRTCPRCLLSFVKSSGCNKLVCNCGYTMCYICRQEITSKEGYGHFCQHFRPAGGRCTECERCDLYGDEDEEAAIRKAAAAAEQAWREKEGGKAGQDGVATQLMVDALVGQARSLAWYEVVVDSVIEAMAA